MRERQKYYKRRGQCERDPENYLSTIGDGMQQAHNDLPWHSNSGTQICSATLGTVLQGMLVHGTPTASLNGDQNRRSRMSVP